MVKVKLSGADFLAFWHDKAVWEGKYVEDEAVTVDGRALTAEEGDAGEVVKPSSTVVVEGGLFVADKSDPSDGEEFAGVLRMWLKNRDTAAFVVRVKRGQEADLRAAVKALGGEVVA